MILATQQPSRQVITGPIQTNINARVGLRLPSPIESQLLGEAGGSAARQGDLLYKSSATRCGCNRLICRRKSLRRCSAPARFLAMLAAPNEAFSGAAS